HLTKPTPDHVSVIGPKFIGKTVLLQHLAEHFRPGHAPYKTSFYWDMRHLTPDSDRAFKQRLAVELKGALQQVLPDLAAELDPQSDEIAQTIQTALDILQDDDLRILGVMDGFDRVLATASLTRNLWDYMLDLARRSSLRLVTGSQRRLQDLCKTPESRTSDFWEIFYDTPLRVGPFIESDWEDLLAPFGERGITLDSSARKELINWSGSVPVLFAAVASRLCETYRADLEISKSEVDRVAEQLADEQSSITEGLWQDCPADIQGDLADLADRDIPLSEIPERRRRGMEERGLVAASGNQLRFSCRLMQYYARRRGEGVANMCRLFGSPERYDENIRALLELRFAQIKDADADLAGYVEKAIRDLKPEPCHSIVWTRNIAERALKMIWEAELPDGSIPMAWIEEWIKAEVRGSWMEDRKVPRHSGTQCGLLRVMTGTQNSKPVARYVTKATAILLDHVQSVGDLGQHPECSISLQFAASVCLAEIALLESLTENLKEHRDFE
ncbi:MAG: hypothetical protein ABSH28_11330, partial [Acidobacteriota bacterium]